MALWHLRISGVYNAEFFRYREDLAKDYSIVKIGYNLSKDVREFRKENNYVNLLREQLKKDNPDVSNSAIGQYLRAVKEFMKIKKDDYIISPYYNSPNGGKVSIGHVIGELETLENLIGSNLNSFAQKYKNEDYILASAKNLVLKVKWDTELFEKDLLLDDKIKEKIKSRLTLIPLDFSGELPYCLAPRSVFTQSSNSIQKINSSKALESTQSKTLQKSETLENYINKILIIYLIKNLMICLRKFKEIKEKITHNWIIALATAGLAIIAFLEYIS